MNTALITGLTGQDGALLAKLLLERNYRVVGAVRRSAAVHLWRLEELGILGHQGLSLTPFDLLDADGARRILAQAHPDEVYNLAAQSSVTASFAEPLLTLHAVGTAPVQLLESIRQLDPKIRFFQASSADMYGRLDSAPQDEDTPFCPRTPYGAAKVYAHWMTVSYRDNYGIFGCSGILYNH
jgi:GDPmannose 4,6-dehydratase